VVEDEMGFVNLVVWNPVFEKHSVLARTALLMGVTGRVQSEKNVVYLIADELWDPRLRFLSQGVTVRSFY
jgi:error-prone DNA polymerase